MSVKRTLKVYEILQIAMNPARAFVTHICKTLKNWDRFSGHLRKHECNKRRTKNKMFHFNNAKKFGLESQKNRLTATMTEQKYICETNEKPDNKRTTKPPQPQPPPPPPTPKTRTTTTTTRTGTTKTTRK